MSTVFNESLERSLKSETLECLVRVMEDTGLELDLQRQDSTLEVLKGAA